MVAHGVHVQPVPRHCVSDKSETVHEASTCIVHFIALPTFHVEEDALPVHF